LDNLIDHLEKLKYFKTVAECSSFYKASLKTGITQPALTRSIQNLEFVLGKKLFTRSQKGVKLTADGADLLVLSTDLFEVIHTWRNKTLHTQSEPALIKRLRIGTYDNLASNLLSPLIKRLDPKFDDIEIKLITGTSNQLTQELLDKNIDFVILAEPRRHREIVYKQIANETYGFFASQKFLDSQNLKGPSLRLNQLKSLRLLTIPAAIAGLSQTVDRLMWESKIPRAVEFNSFEMVKSAMLQDVGIALIPKISVYHELKNGHAKQVFIDGVPKKNLGLHSLYLLARSDTKDWLYDLIFNEAQAALVGLTSKTN
jgi:LysR family nitrogen assimilation transcriptional regulator